MRIPPFVRAASTAPIVSCVGAVLVSALASSCVSRDPAPLYGAVEYQVRCIDCTPVAADGPVHRVANLNGDEDEDGSYRVECTADKGAKDHRLVSFTIAFTDAKRDTNDFSFSVTQVDVDAKDPGTRCQVEVVEGVNELSGKCTDGAPTDDAPCRVSLKPDGDSVKGTVFCTHLAGVSDGTLVRHIVAPTSNDEFEVRVDGCTGM